MWTEGFLAADVSPDDEVQVTIVTSQVEVGMLMEVDSYYAHSYGKCVPKLMQIDRNHRALLYGDDK